MLRSFACSVSVALLAFSTLPVNAQEMFAPSHGEQLAAMKKLAPMVGEWKGKGWIEMGPRRFDFESSEVFASRAGGLAIVVEGRHQMAFPGGQTREIHNACGMITYDVEKKVYRFVTQLANGRSGDYQGAVPEDGDFQWTIPDSPMGKMVYTIKLGDGKYTEVGEIVSDKGERKQFFEMTLEKTAG